MFSKYYELGLAVIPILPNSKRPVGEATEYTRWASERQPPELIETWEERYRPKDGYGVGIITGAVSGISTVDIDTLRPDIISECPVSPVVRRGNPQRYGALFFRHNPEISNQPFAHFEKNLDLSDEPIKHGVDIISFGKYIIVPPAVNPDAKVPYAWLTLDTLENFDVKDLPLLLPEHILKIEKKFEALNAGQIGGTASPHAGRNDYLRSIVWAKRLNGESEEDIVEAIYQIDMCKHSPRLFTDPEEFPAANEEEARYNAWKFESSITRTFIRRRAGRAPRIRLPEVSLAQPAAKKWEPLLPPEPEGLVRDVRDLILKSSKYSQPGLALAGSLAICSVLIANRFKCGETWPNIYVLGIAPTGSGKQFPINAAMKLLLEEHETGLFGKEQVLSGQAFIKGLDVQHSRLDVIDECSNLFQMIQHGGVFQADILPIMLKLYSCSNTLFIGPETKGSDPIRVFHPSVSALMLTNPDDLKLSVTRNFLTGGFLPRCLPFIEEQRGERHETFGWDETLAKKIGNRIEELLAMKILFDEKNKNVMCPKPKPREVPLTDAAKKVIRDFDLEIDAQTARTNLKELKRHMYSRAVQNAEKLALIHGVHRSGIVDELDAMWAVETIKALHHNCEPLYEKLMASSPSEAATLGVIDIVRKAGSMSEAEFFAATRVLSKMQRNDAVQAAQIEGKIRVTRDQNGVKYESLV